MKRNTAQLKEQLIQTGIDEIGKHGIEQLAQDCCQSLWCNSSRHSIPPF